jgi:Kef-type K+ transport system membrane component KefB/mannitol/fructose-specific phosphotransferase system IIA component (Ntr-type)/nucleotide-binding universal stress UspA family protein
MFATGVSISLPVTNPVLIFALAMVVFLVAPLVVERFRVPGMVGIIVAGAILGPHGLHVLERGQTIVLLGTVGLIYLMFLAGVEIDLHGFRRYRWQSLGFGVLTFALPMGLGWGAGRVLGFAPASALLLGALLASHTLVAYPLALSMGIVRNGAVTAAVGGTMITDTAALLVLAVVSSATRGALDAGFWIRLGGSLALFVILITLGLPRLTRWYFRRETTGTAATFLYVMTALFAGAFLAEVAGVEAIIGAFLVGLALNRLIPRNGLLSNRIHFVGEAFLIPFFLLSIGMLVDVRVFLSGARAWEVLVALLVTGVLGKWLAAEGTRLVFRLTPAETGSVFGLSVSRASATLAIALIGHEVGLFDEFVENGVVVLMAVTVFLGPWLVERHGRALALAEEQQSLARGEAPARILVPMSNPRTAPALLDLALVLREARSPEPLFALTVVPDEGETAEAYVANAEQMLSKAVAYAAGAGVQIQAITRVDQNFASGIVRGAVETRTATIVIGWDGRTSRQRVFGSVLDQLLDLSQQQVIVAKLGHPVSTTRRIVALPARGSDHHAGFADAVGTLKRLANGLGASLHVLVLGQDDAGYLRAFQQVTPDAPVKTERVDGWASALGTLRQMLRPEDLVVVVSARRGTVSWDPYLHRLPARLAKLVPESFLLLYPSERREPPLHSDVELPAALARRRVIHTLPGRSVHGALDALLEREYQDDRGRRRDILRMLLHSDRGAAIELTPGVVIAHARLDFLDEPRLFLGRSPEGVQFPGSTVPARLVFLLLSSTDEPAAHLATLADVARLVADKPRIQAIQSAGTEEALVRALVLPSDGERGDPTRLAGGPRPG